ncbi:DUF72 domain-containing protein [Bdellovibrio sp. 22V]|uniref:DUF72 domain-containing protein n=1 Tax=Bdellovibrio TaxID=958 RepID=UPI002543B948|nr:DUF72 domain-containing protein [Bdellovibrio sp. 22V]WII72679.1 DUF72 domain-containing protein [Bdellovibrio sp. 22V]
MEFGKLASVDSVDWTLPPDDPASAEYLQKLSGTALPSTRYLLGTPAWGHKEWIGKIYPAKTKPADFLFHYSRNYDTIELNTTHYRIPSSEQVKKWQEQVTPHFQFCPKVFQGITHSAQGLSDKKLYQEWFQFLANIRANLGPCFAQFPPHFDYSKKAQLFYFLQQWPQEFELALEFRHPSWFEEGRILSALTKYLQTRNVGLVITDVAGRRDVLHTSISAPFTMLRIIGNDLHASDYTRSREWAQRLSQWSQQGLQRVYYFVHEPDDLKSPEMTQALIQYLNEECDAQLNPLTWCAVSE